MKNTTRKWLAVLMAAVMLCLLIPVGAVVMAAENPIVNGGFEDGTTGWKFNSGTAEIVSDAHSGSSALSLTNPGQWGEAAIQTIPVEANTDYVFTWYGKRVSGTGAFNLYVMNAVGYGNVERLAGQNWMNDTSKDWIKYEYTINTGDATSLMLKWSTEAKNPGTILIDDFSIAKIGGDEPAAGNIEELLGNIKTQGRTAMINGTLMLDFALSGVEFELDCSGDVYATFNARKLASTSSTGGIYFTVVVDGVKQARDFCRITTGGETKFLLAEGLSAGKHTFAIYRQSEHQYGEIGISALSFDGTILDKPADKDLYIEFIGDSISNGYGILGNSSQGDGSALWSDATQAYNFLTAEALNADFSNPSWSGLGCKYGYSSITMQDVYPAQRYNFDKNTPYAFDKEPDIVVLALGTNDNSKGPDTASIRAGLKEMLTLVRAKNPNAPIVWIYGMMTNNLNTMIEEIVAEFGGTEAGYYACKLTTSTNGGGWHPSVAGQKKFADELVAFIKENGLDGEPVVPSDPAADSVLTIPQANELGLSKENNTYTEGKYYVTGKIVAISNATYGNMYIVDENNNQFMVYGTYSANGEIRYDALEYIPVVGDTITVYGIIGTYNGSEAQMKNGWITEIVKGEGEPENTDPAADSVLTVKEAIELGLSKLHNVFTENKYYVTAEITEIYNDIYGNMYVKDAEGNVLTIYGTYDADGTNRFDAMENKPVVGDTVKLYGIVGQYNGNPQMKNAWIVAINPTDEPVDPEEPSEPSDPEEPSEPDAPVDPETPVDPEAPVDPETPDEPGTESPETGDNSTVYVTLAVVLMALAAAAAFITSKKRA